MEVFGGGWTLVTLIKKDKVDQWKPETLYPWDVATFTTASSRVSKLSDAEMKGGTRWVTANAKSTLYRMTDIPWYSNHGVKIHTDINGTSTTPGPSLPRTLSDKLRSSMLAAVASMIGRPGKLCQVSTSVDHPITRVHTMEVGQKADTFTCEVKVCVNWMAAYPLSHLSRRSCSTHNRKYVHSLFCE